MGYYTVEVRSSRPDVAPRIFRGIKAKNQSDAYDQVFHQVPKEDRWDFKIYLSKRRERRYKHGKHARKLRRPWAVLAKNAKRQHFNVLNRWSNLHYHRLTYVAWLDDTPPVFPVMDKLKELFPDMRSVADLGNELIAGVSAGEAVKALVHAYYERESAGMEPDPA